MQPLRARFALLLFALAACGCARSTPSAFSIAPLPPSVELTVAPAAGDSVPYSAAEFRWVGIDSDGQVVGYRYAVDPTPATEAPGETAWVETTASHVAIDFTATTPPSPLPPPGTPVWVDGYHTFVVQAVDNDGLRSPPVARSFNARTVAPETTILWPNGTDQVAITTPPAFLVEWRGEDPDGSRGPVRYKWRLARRTDVDPVGYPTKARLQEYFGADAGTRFANWDSLPGDSASKVLTDLMPGVTYYFALVAFDEAGAYEPRFDLNTNVLQFRPTIDNLGPKIRVFNEYFTRMQAVGGVSLAETRIVKMQFPADAPLVFNWSAMPNQAGVRITGYRWALDIPGQAIEDETPRTGPDDLAHWSAWSPDVTSAGVGPFAAPPAGDTTHHLYVEARDNLGFVSLFTLRMTIVAPVLDRPLLVIDDVYGSLTQAVDPADPGGAIRLSASYPLEAESDSFLFAQGGFPDSLYIRAGFSGVMSRRGAFADYAPDTLDYQFHPYDGIDLDVLLRYRAVVWFVDKRSATRTGPRFGSTQPSTALRAINSRDRLNTLAVYLRSGGSVWLLGEGATTAIANGYFTRYGSVPPPPYTSGEDPRVNVLIPGDFLYDFCHLRSVLAPDPGAGWPDPGASVLDVRVRSCIPNLPEFIGPASDGDRTHDPRIDPASAARTAQRWAGLPRLTPGAYRGADGVVLPAGSWFLKAPNRITTGAPSYVPTLDTLYWTQSVRFDPNRLFAPIETDGFPNAVHYHGTENGPGSQLVWFGFPLVYFDLEQARQVTRRVMDNFGIAPAPGAMRSRKTTARAAH